MIQIQRKWSLVVTIAAMFVTVLAAAENLEDFKKAAEAMAADKGCDSIPYSGYRNTCNDKQTGVKDRCRNEDKPYSCDKLLTKAFIENINKMDSQVKALDDKKKDFESQLSSSSTSDSEKSQLPTKIADVTKERDGISTRLEEMKKQLEKDIETIKQRLDNGRTCLEYRVAVQDIFMKDATSNAKGESDPLIKPIANDLITYWEKGNKDHQESIDGTKTAIARCENARDGKE